MVSRSRLWQSLMVTRFGEDALLVNSSFNSAALRALYIRKSRTIVPALEIGVGTDSRHPQQLSKALMIVLLMQAVHLGTQYLTHEHRADSTFGQVLLLRWVCWLDLQAKFYVGHCV
ncbi:hypothetical protein ABBQ32_008570 [Trebouxia sp. C0010 RCD-2024]